MTRDELVRYLTERRLAAKRNVTNRTHMRSLIRGDLEAMDDADLQIEYDQATGASRPTNADATNYGYTTLDHAVSDAVALRERSHDGERTFTDDEVAAILTRDHGATLAGRALSLATDGAYRETIPRSARRHGDADPGPTLTLAEYRTTIDG